MKELYREIVVSVKAGANKKITFRQEGAGEGPPPVDFPQTSYFAPTASFHR
jgi:hypothetical protein